VTAAPQAGIARRWRDPDLVGRLRPEGKKSSAEVPRHLPPLLRKELAQYETIVATARLKLH